MATSEADWQNALARARRHAPFLTRMLDRFPEIAELLAEGRWAEARTAAAEVGMESPLDGLLRRRRGALSLVLAIGDLAGALSLEDVTSSLSDFADEALSLAIGSSISRRVDGANSEGFYALALGKHGARELNYSSDIDPILLYDPERLARRERDEPGEAAQRYAREIVRILSDNTADGFVFRVDLRLRPASEVSPLAIPEGAALTHYESAALPWERAAFLRARAASGDIVAGETFLAAIEPFVWRRSLDFGAIAEIGALTARIRDAKQGPAEPSSGYNVKLGRGGIREIEFFVQTHQLIHGGRVPSLRVRGIAEGLDALVEAGLVPSGDASILTSAYRRLRTVEHRLQMVEDRQTHTLPEGAALDAVARLDGLDDGAALLDDIAVHTRASGKLFDRLLEQVGGEGAGTASPPSAKAIEAIVPLPQIDRERLETRITGWLDGRYRPLRSPAAQDAFRSLLPTFLEAVAATSEPDEALLRWEKLLASMPPAINLFRLLEARPGLLDQLLRILSLAPPLADELARSPSLLDALIDRSALDLPGDVAGLAERMRSAEGVDYERALDRLRIETGEQRFALGVQLIEAAHDAQEIAGGLSRVAEAAVHTALALAREEFVHRHGRIADSEMVVLGLGRLGGRALTHASDLDLVFLFTGDFSAESDGDKPLGGTLYFNRLAQRVGAALSVPTAQGALYEVDTRLRPQGNQGPLAVGLDSFVRYQRENAWTWEHMALTRARAVAGPPQARAAVEAALGAILAQDRDDVKLREDVVAMRADMARHKSPSGPLDAKLLRGGLVDLEFLVHHQQLRHRIGLVPELGNAVATLEANELLPAGSASAHDTLTRIIVAMRLVAPDGQVPGGIRADALARACGASDLDALLRDMQASRQCVAEGWRRYLSCELETDR